MLKKFTVQTNNLIGIDINQKHIHAVELAKFGSSLTVKSYAYAKQISDVDLTKKSIITGIAHTDIHFQEINLQQKLTPIEIEKFLRLNLEKYLKHSIKNSTKTTSSTRDLAFDFTVINNSLKTAGTTIQLITVAKAIIQQHLDLFKPYDFVHKIIDLNIYALERITRIQAPIGDDVFATINIDLTQLLIVVIDKYKILYAYTEFIENTHGCELATKLINILQNIPHKIERLFLAGQQNIKLEILTIITNKLNLETKTINPFIGMRLPKNIDHEIIPALAISCGLALRVNDARWN